MFCGLYYKHVTIANDDSSVVSKWSLKLIDNARLVIYNCNMFTIKATGYVGTWNNILRVFNLDFSGLFSLLYVLWRHGLT
jgi:hypothetical protein